MKSNLFLITLVVALAPAAALALGFRIADQDAFATARGNAFAATADNPSAIFYNPAGITQLEGHQFRLGAYAVTYESRFTPERGPSFSNDEEWQMVPQFYYTFSPPDHPVSLGLGVYSPFGLSMKYSDDVIFRTMGTFGGIKFATINPVLAYQICDTLSIAIGGQVHLAQVELRQGISMVGDEFRFRGAGVGYGFNAGLLWKPHPMHSFGVTYRSATKISFSGHTKAKLSSTQKGQIREANEAIRTIKRDVGPFGPAAVASTLASFGLPSEEIPERFPEEDADVRFQFPQSIVFGYSFRPTPDWNFEVNIDWTDWDNLNTLTLHQQRSPDIRLPFNWQSSFFYEFGVTRYLPCGFHASGGYIFSENSVPDRWFTPLVPDSDRHIFSTGLGQRFNNFSWDIAYQLAYGFARRVNNGTLADGSYRFTSHAVTLSFGFTY